MKPFAAARVVARAIHAAVASLPAPRFRHGTEEERTQAIGAARKRLSGLRAQAFRGDQLSAASRAEQFELDLIERLQRGDAFTVPDREAKQ